MLQLLLDGYNPPIVKQILFKGEWARPLFKCFSKETGTGDLRR
jgi:hypothetical protein